MSKRPHRQAESTQGKSAEAMARIEKARKRGATGLSLDSLGLTTLPESIGELSKLRSLSLMSNKLTALPESIGQLSKLQRLFLIGNNLKSLPESIGQLVQLEMLLLNGNLLTELPESIGHLSKLEMLFLDDNRLTALPESVGQLSRLYALTVSKNRLTGLPESLRSLKNLDLLHLHGNNSLDLPAEVLGPGVGDKGKPSPPAKILDYYFRTRGSQRRPLNEAKLILVGRGEVGKTSIVNQLVHRKFKVERKTEGIKITDWSLTLPKKEKVRLHVWDFGGQEIMHATHQFFLTERSLYLLVLNGRAGGEDADAEYWLKLIQSFGGNSPVIVVLNKSKEHPFDVNRNALERKYPFIRGFVKTDCKANMGIAELRRLVAQETDALEHLRDAFPANWFSIKDRLAGMEENYLNMEEYRKECAKLGEGDPKAQEQLAGYLHSLGIALNYREDTRLKDTHVLNPHWLTGGIYKILNADKLERQKGEIRLGDLPGMLDKNSYPAKMHGFILELMKKFELCFSLPEEESCYLVPELLDKQEPTEAREFEPEECLNFEYHYPVLPEGWLPRFIVRTHVLSDHTPRWRTGVVLKLEDNLALVRADAQERRVTVNIKGPVKGRRRLLSIVRENFDRMHADIPKLQPAEIVPLPGHPGAHVTYEELFALERNRTKKFPKVVDGGVIELDVQKLLNGVELAGERGSGRAAKDGREFDERMGIGRKFPARVFISYSHKDERLLDELKTHLSPLRRQRIIQTWNDRDIEAGDDWREKINENLERADIIILLVSARFIASDYCFKKEMKHALARHRKKEARVVPIIVRDANWKAVKELKGLEALPKDGKPMMNQNKRDTAWREVSESIQKIIESMKAADPLKRRAP